VHDATRKDAIEKMKSALNEFVIEGIKTTIPFHKKVFSHPDFISGEFDTGFAEKVSQPEGSRNEKES
jgi:acetyl-CoA carboxylase biotin carboxylase subunit